MSSSITRIADFLNAFSKSCSGRLSYLDARLTSLERKVTFLEAKVGVSEDAIAVKVDGYPSSNKIPHVTIAIPKDGKPFHSNLITDWRPVDEEIIIKGKVREIYS